VATDGHRLARADVDAPSGSEGMPGIIIPRKTVGEMQKLVDNPDMTVTVEVSDAKIRFTIGSVVMTSKLIDGTFPDYQRVIPTGNDKELRSTVRPSLRRSTGCRRSRQNAAARSSWPLPKVN
jgi:DNA polymerase-3 subunit beta